MSGPGHERAKCLRLWLAFDSCLWGQAGRGGACYPLPRLPASTPLTTMSLPVCPEQRPAQRAVLGKTCLINSQLEDNQCFRCFQGPHWGLVVLLG